MIRYTLACEAGHAFESWFPSSASYDEQAARGLVACPTCGSAKVGKAVMAPSVARAESRPPRACAPAGEVRAGEVRAGAAPADSPVPMTAEPERRLRAMLRALREHVRATADHVGTRFPEEARRMHYGEVPARPIYGEASPDEARALIEEGVEVAPLPPAPDDRH